MSGIPVVDRRAVRRQATAGEIVAAAWELSRANGLGNFTMRQLGERVGMRAQSLYSYFASKHELFDAMFAAGNRELVAWMRAAAADGSAGVGDRTATIRRAAHRFFTFCVSDPVRYQLLFQRTIPGFVPSEASFAVAQEAYDAAVAPLAGLGITGPDLDLVTAVMTGLAAQQLANDPGGDRWERLVDRATAMLLREVAPDALARPRTRRRT